MGIVTKPIEGAKTEGAGGFFKGVGRGLGGLLAKPVTGIVDATSTAFAGVQTQLDVKEHVRRIRYPRVVDEAPLESYKYRLAYAQELLWSLDEDFLPNTEEITDLGNQTPLGMGYTNRERFIIIVTAKTICLIDKRTTTGRLKAEWIRNIQQCQIVYGGGSGEYSQSDITIQIKDNRGAVKMVKIQSGNELEHVKRAISQSKNEISTREDFEIESIV